MQYIDILILTEIRLDDAFPTVKFLVTGFSESCKLDRNRNGEDILIYIRENSLSKLLDKDVELNVELCEVYFLKYTSHDPPKQIFISLII